MSGKNGTERRVFGVLVRSVRSDVDQASKVINAPDSYLAPWDRFSDIAGVSVGGRTSGEVRDLIMNLVALPLWISERDVAERWGVSIFTVQRERKRGKLKA